MSLWRDLALIPREAWSLFAATLVNRAGMMALPFLVLRLTRRLSFSWAVGGLLSGGPWLGTTVLERWEATALWGGTFAGGIVSAILFWSLPEPARGEKMGGARP